MITSEKCERESWGPLALEIRSNEQFSHLEQLAASPATAAVARFSRNLSEHIVSPMLSTRPILHAQFATSKRTSLIPH